MEHDLRTTPCRPANCLTVAPSFVADHRAKLHTVNLKEASSRAVRVCALLGGIDLDFILKTPNAPVPIDNQCGSEQRAINNPLGAKDYRDIGLGCALCNFAPGRWRAVPPFPPRKATKELGKLEAGLYWFRQS
jgi:hypothetical protein